jgi:UDP-N-acetylglucosamine/UDP-N-acetylgalactosamine diphosphorylase
VRTKIASLAPRRLTLIATFFQKKGDAEVHGGRVALLLLAGGAGTRLGFDHPKGMYDVGMPSRKCLYQYFSERITTLQKLSATACGSTSTQNIMWYIMTSQTTHNETVQCFQSNNFFGLDPSQMFFFQQGMLPAFSLDGKIMMDTPTSVTKAANGNGGLYMAMRDSGALKDMETRGVTNVFCFGVDNAICQIADPQLLGYTAHRELDICSKTCKKANAGEKVGLVCLKDGKPTVIEYSDISDELRTKTTDNGELYLQDSHICINVFGVKFLRQVVDKYIPALPYHVARKKIHFVTPDGQTAKPDDINGVKMEMFIFDVFPYARLAIFDAERESNFSPVKNPPGSETDSPDSCRALMSALHQRYVRAAGVSISGDGLCEVSPLVSYAGEGLGDAVKKAGVTSMTLPALIVSKDECLSASVAEGVNVYKV